MYCLCLFSLCNCEQFQQKSYWPSKASNIYYLAPSSNSLPTLAQSCFTQLIFKRWSLFIETWYISCQRRTALKITTAFYRNRTLDFYMQGKRWLPILKSIYRTQFFKAPQNLCSERKVTLSCLQVLCWVSLRGGSEVENFEGKTVITECKKGPGAQIWTSMWGAPSGQQ